MGYCDYYSLCLNKKSLYNKWFDVCLNESVWNRRAYPHRGGRSAPGPRPCTSSRGLLLGVVPRVEHRVDDVRRHHVLHADERSRRWEVDSSLPLESNSQEEAAEFVACGHGHRHVVDIDCDCADRIVRFEEVRGVVHDTLQKSY